MYLKKVTGFALAIALFPLYWIVVAPIGVISQRTFDPLSLNFRQPRSSYLKYANGGR